MQKNLEWSRENYGPMTWDEAMDGAETCHEGGHTDWRLPTIDELETLTTNERSAQAAHLWEIPTPKFYWSSTVPVNSTDSDWAVAMFFSGGADGYDKSHAGFARYVR